MAVYAYNGWLASDNPADFGGLEAVVVAGESFIPGVRAGDVALIFRHLAEQLHARVEPIIAAGWHDADDWGYSFRKNRNADNISCHGAGCAIDYNATRHPNGARGTFNNTQVAEIRKILAELGGVVRWGGDFTGTADEMHWEICSTEAGVAAVAARLRGTPIPPAPLPPVNHYRPTIKQGDRGAAVFDLQRKLVTAYPAYNKYEPTGYFGTKTNAGVREFQRRSGLTVDGIVGPITWRALGLG